MVSLTITPTHFCIPHKPVSHLSARSIFPVVSVQKRAKIARKAAFFCSFLGKRGDFFGFFKVGEGEFLENSWCCWCRERWESEGDTELEAQILDFMETSSKPGAFPTKDELVEAGRLDLVEAIKNRGGWFSMGWESEDEANEGGNAIKRETLKLDFDVKDFQRRVETCKASGSLEENEDAPLPSSSDASDSPFSEDSSAASSQSAPSSGRSLEEDNGIDGILSRLEKERTSSFGINVGMSAYRANPSSKDPGDFRHQGTFKDLEERTNEDRHFNHNIKPDTWRSWSLHRAGFKDSEFEAAEISYGEARIEDNVETSKEEGLAAVVDVDKDLHKWNLTHNNHIQTHLEQLQLELASTLHSLRSKSEGINSTEVPGHSSSDFQSLSDTLEFQQNEFMSSQERLRSIRAKLAVLEGKMALAITDAQKILREKQMRIDSACRTLELLHTTCIVWPNAASEVLLSGSFDGWTTQRKMKKSSTGIFSLCLKLYPGRYEIKFIVDGKWRVDPLGPIVFNNGYENNLLVITEKKAQSLGFGATGA